MVSGTLACGPVPEQHVKAVAAYREAGSTDPDGTD